MRTLSGLIAALSLWAVPASPQTENWMARAEMRFHQNLIDRVGAAETRKIAPFTTDGCSGGLSWSWERLVDLVPSLAPQEGERPPWEECCVAHDRAYHDIRGATTAQESFATRLAADEELQRCVAAVGHVAPDKVDDWGMTPALYERLAQSMFWAVRFGGGPCSGLSWRWGYGLENC